MHYLITRKELSLVIFRRINIFWPIATEELRKYSVSFRMTSDVRWGIFGMRNGWQRFERVLCFCYGCRYCCRRYHVIGKSSVWAALVH